MSDNVTLNSGSGGATLSTDDIAGVQVQRVKVQYGVDGSATDVSDSNPMPIDDAGGSLTVDNAALSVTGGGVEASALRVTIASDSTGVVSVDDNGASLTVDNAALSVTGGGVEASALRVTLASDSTGLLSVDDNGASLTVDNAALSVVGGGAEATALRVTIASDSTGVVSIDDNGGSITVDGTVTANATLAAETTKVIGTVNISSGQSVGLAAGSNLVGDVGISGARTSGGTSIFRSIDLDEGACEVVKAGPGQIYWIHAMNLASSVRFIKIYNATSGTVGTGTPVLTLPLATQGSANGAGFLLQVPNGIAFSTGICIGASTGVADADTGAPGTNDLIVNIGYA